MKRLIARLLGVALALACATASPAFAGAPSTITSANNQNVATVDSNSDLHVACDNCSPGGSGNPATIYSGQQTVTTSAVALPSQALINGIVITALPTNSAAIYVGPPGVTSSTGYALQPGASISYGVLNLSAVDIVSAASTTDKVTFTGN